MAQLTDVQLQAEKEIIKTETETGANTATRIGQLFEDINDSKLNKADYVESDNNFTDALKNKLDDIEDGAQVNEEYTVIDQNYTHINPPLANQTFVPANGINLAHATGVSYAKYTQSGSLDITIAVGSIENGCATMPILTDGNAITVTGATKWSKSDTASGAGVEDMYVFWKTAPTTANTTGIWYNITNPA